ncbi:acyltransferase [Clostridium sp.]|jgi:transferase hexapeptide repeat containing protein|uniref:acyltransferase n=1 Tax=Clostridium sp. TaxID=1506 RepID=UPI0025F16505|nr:acyltransferase [Clostridium sp.]MDY2630695.1 acyltransferase [Clostridium sp.]
MNSFYNYEELITLGLKKIGNNVLISKKASIYDAKKISIGNNVRIDDFCILSGEITIGDYIHIAAYSGLFAGDKGIELKEFVNISSRVSIYAISDDYSGRSLTNPMTPLSLRNVYGGKVTLGRHAIIGSATVILPNIRIGDGVAVGACSLINKDCDEWSIYGGVPAKKIKERSKKLLEFEEKLYKGVY